MNFLEFPKLIKARIFNFLEEPKWLAFTSRNMLQFWTELQRPRSIQEMISQTSSRVCPSCNSSNHVMHMTCLRCFNVEKHRYEPDVCSGCDHYYWRPSSGRGICVSCRARFCLICTRDRNYKYCQACWEECTECCPDGFKCDPC